MINARCIERTSLDVRSSGDRRKRVDAYFVCYDCPADEVNSDRHEWVCKFEVPCGTAFKMRDFPTKSAARAEQGYTLCSRRTGLHPMSATMKHPKSFYRTLNHAGYSWGGFWDGHHIFTKPANTIGGFFEMKVLESDIEDGSWKFMAERGFTRI